MISDSVFRFNHFKHWTTDTVQRDCKWRSVQTFPRRSLLSARHTRSQYTGKCHFIYANKESAAFLAPIFTGLSYRISPKSGNKCKKCGQNSIYVPKQSVTFTVPIFTKLAISQYTLVNISFIKLYPNRTTYNV